MTLESYFPNGEWKDALSAEFNKPYFRELDMALNQARKTIYPPRELIFEAFKLTPLSQVKVVILGQDPYHDDGEAMGLSFSVPKAKSTRPSLKNIYKELERDPKILGFKDPGHGDLTLWAMNGVLLLNAVLTVEAHRPRSHDNLGWHKFTDRVIQTVINENCDHVVFILMGDSAKQKEVLVDSSKHIVIKTTHPSPEAYRATVKFAGCACFSECNEALESMRQTAVDWTL